MKKHVVYIAGPMRGKPKFNFPLFNSVARQIRALGHTVINPAELDKAFGLDLTDVSQVTPEIVRSCVRRDVEALTHATLMVLLPGWQGSTGATAERAVCGWMGVTVCTVEEFLEDPERW